MFMWGESDITSGDLDDFHSASGAQSHVVRAVRQYEPHGNSGCRPRLIELQCGPETRVFISREMGADFQNPAK
jgi:hypothetical protein